MAAADDFLAAGYAQKQKKSKVINQFL